MLLRFAFRRVSPRFAACAASTILYNSIFPLAAFAAVCMLTPAAPPTHSSCLIYPQGQSRLHYDRNRCYPKLLQKSFPCLHFARHRVTSLCGHCECLDSNPQLRCIPPVRVVYVFAMCSRRTQTSALNYSEIAYVGPTLDFVQAVHFQPDQPTVCIHVRTRP